MVPTKRQVSAERTRRRLLAVALEEFSRRPYAEVTVGDIARSAGVAQGLVSHHFRGKPGLYTETLREIGRRLARAREADPVAPPGDRLRQHLRGHLSFLAEHEDAARNLVLGGGCAVTEAREAFDALRSHELGGVCDVLGLDFARPAVRLVMWSFASAADALTRQWLDNGRTFDVDVVMAAVVELLKGSIRGIGALAPDTDVTEPLTLLNVVHRTTFRS